MTPTVPQAEALCAPSHWRTVDFLSDLHLQASDPATLAWFARTLERSDADAIFLLGDVFEVWVGDDAADEAGSFEAQLAALLAEAAHRRPIYFMHGNRDFLVGPDFLRRTGMQALADPTLLVLGAQRVLLTHGDLLCVDDTDYQQFRLQARSSAWQQAFLAQPLAQRREQARAIRAQSEARKQSNAVYADVDTAAALAWLQAAGAPTLVHGHTHRSATHALAPGFARTVLSDWDAAAHPPRADVLRLGAAGLERRIPASS